MINVAVWWESVAKHPFIYKSNIFNTAMALGWTEGLNTMGINYYEGWVEDIDARLSSHAKATVTCHGTPRSSKASGNTAADKENVNTTKVQHNIITIINSE